mmetsp:Transcript_10591/g.39453  ORF Transcript_10591/g.39453 Transcript_10591/m.39453 type:complete len:187 (-) Transcript_10591:1662-2222(-)
MGNSTSDFTKEELHDYESCTFFSRREILSLHSIFMKLGKKEDSNFSKNSILPLESVKSLPSLLNNPFRDEIVSIFASDETGQTFDDFVDMCSAFSPNADVKVKEQVCFVMMDYSTADGFLTVADLKNVLSKQVGDKNMSDQQIHAIAVKFFEEIDVDRSDSISLTEFSRLVSRVPEFSRKFIMRVI